jgi:hypothetical protein
MATKKMTKSKGPKMKKYGDGGSSRSFNLFGKTYTKTNQTTTNDDGSTTRTKVKTVRYNDGDIKKVKIKKATTNEVGDPIKGSISKTRFYGDGDVQQKSKSYTIPSNSMLMREKKGGSIKGKKIIKSKKK